jgi:hypothetical protein
MSDRRRSSPLPSDTRSQSYNTRGMELSYYWEKDSPRNESSYYQHSDARHSGGSAPYRRYEPPDYRSYEGKNYESQSIRHVSETDRRYDVTRDSSSSRMSAHTPIHRDQIDHNDNRGYYYEDEGDYGEPTKRYDSRGRMWERDASQYHDDWIGSNYDPRTARTSDGYYREDVAGGAKYDAGYYDYDPQPSASMDRSSHRKYLDVTMAGDGSRGYDSNWQSYGESADTWQYGGEGYYGTKNDRMQFDDNYGDRYTSGYSTRSDTVRSGHYYPRSDPSRGDSGRGGVTPRDYREYAPSLDQSKSYYRSDYSGGYQADYSDEQMSISPSQQVIQERKGEHFDAPYGAHLVSEVSSETSEKALFHDLSDRFLPWY